MAFADVGFTGTVDLTNTNLKKIGASAFCNCNQIVSLILPNTVNHIASFAFKDCTGLRSSGKYIHVVSYNENWDSRRIGHLQRDTTHDIPGASHPYAWSGAAGVYYTNYSEMSKVQSDGSRIYETANASETRCDITKRFAGAIECHFPSSILESDGTLSGCGIEYECFRFV